MINNSISQIVLSLSVLLLLLICGNNTDANQYKKSMIIILNDTSENHKYEVDGRNYCFDRLLDLIKLAVKGEIINKVVVLDKKKRYDVEDEKELYQIRGLVENYKIEFIYYLKKSDENLPREPGLP